MHPCTRKRDAQFSKKHTLYGRQCSFKYQQLRDLVHCSEDPARVYISFDTALLRYDINDDEDVSVHCLSYEPTCMAYAGGYIAAGGCEQQLDVKRVADHSVLYSGVVGQNRLHSERVHNAIHIAPAVGPLDLGGGPARLYLSTNESDIKVYSLPSMTPLTTIRCRVNINYAAQSPDGRHLVAVGDCDSAFLYQITPTGYQLVQQFVESKDHGMSCAWSPLGSFYAAAHQCGTTTVFDIKSNDVVAKYRVGSGAKCRGVKFSYRGVDLMAFSEETSRVHLADSRMWERTQVLPVAPRDDITGLSFTPSGSCLYVGHRSGLSAFDIDTLARRSFLTAGSYA